MELKQWKPVRWSYLPQPLFSYFLSIIIGLLFIVPGKVEAQSANHEIGIQLGVANYQGDLGAARRESFLQLEPRAFRPAFGLLYRNNFHRFLTFRGSLGISRIFGDDALAEDEWRRERNLNFRTNIVDVSLMLEWNILPYGAGEIRGKRFTPYIGVGISGYYFNPKGQLNGEWIALQPLGTEGQGLAEYPNRTKYERLAFAVPMSLGWKFNISRKLAIGTEFRFMYNFHDYLDDVSTVYPDLTYYDNNYIQAIADEARALSYRGSGDPASVTEQSRGNSAKDDQFFFLMVNLTYSIGKGHVNCPTFR